MINVSTIKKSSFPKKCLLCNIVFLDSIDFVNNTTKPECGKEIFINGNIRLRLRNCKCGSTLAIRA